MSRGAPSGEPGRPVPPITIAREAAGGMRLADTGGWRVELSPAGAGWKVAGDRFAGATLIRDDEAGGLILQRGDGDGAEELARTTPVDPPPSPSPVRHLLLDDGRLFRMTPSALPEASWELQCWESGGAYLVGRPEDRGWTIETTVAGERLEPLDGIVLMFAAEILDAEASV